MCADNLNSLQQRPHKSSLSSPYYLIIPPLLREPTEADMSQPDYPSLRRAPVTLVRTFKLTFVPAMWAYAHLHMTYNACT